jgi:hypothetical protein
MGNLLQRSKKIEIISKDHKAESAELRDNRRRNSLAYNISQYVKLRDSNAQDYSPLVGEIATAIVQQLPPIDQSNAPKKIPRYTKVN